MLRISDQKSYELVSSSPFLAWKRNLYTAPATTPPRIGPAQYTCRHETHFQCTHLP